MPTEDRYALAARCVEAVCNDRRGLHWDFDDEVRAELRDQLAILIQHAIEGTEPSAPGEAVLFRIAKDAMDEDA